MWICGLCMVLLLLRFVSRRVLFPVRRCMEGWGWWGKRVVVFLVAVEALLSRVLDEAHHLLDLSSL